MIFTVDIFQNFFGKRDGRTAWCIQFMNMVCLAHRHVVGKNRKGFALGAVLAAEYTADKQGYLGMSDLFPFLK